MGRFYRMRAASWHRGEENPGCIVTCNQFWAENAREARKKFLEDSGILWDKKVIRYTSVVLGGGR